MKLSSDEFADLVRQALAEIPDMLRSYLEGVVIDIEALPDARTCAMMECDDPSELLGLYQGTPLTERSVELDAQLPDRIVIFQRNIERMCRSKREVVVEIRRTVLHEVGHHFGLDEDELEELGYD